MVRSMKFFPSNAIVPSFSCLWDSNPMDASRPLRLLASADRQEPRSFTYPVPAATSAVIKSWNTVLTQCAEVCSPAISGGGPFNKNLQGATWKSMVPGVSINRSMASTFSSSEMEFTSKAWLLKPGNCKKAAAKARKNTMMTLSVDVLWVRSLPPE